MHSLTKYSISSTVSESILTSRHTLTSIKPGGTVRNRYKLIYYFIIIIPTSEHLLKFCDL